VPVYIYRHTKQRRVPMISQTPGLLQDSIDKLEQLSAILAEELGSGTPAERLPPERRIRKEVLLSISVLLPKLHAAHSLQSQSVSAPRSCPNCDE
jgi:hypothetical protein